MRILLSALGTRGDAQPMVALALALQQAGHHVLVCAPLDFAQWVPSLGLAYHPIQANVAQESARAGMSPRKVLAMIGRAVAAEHAAVTVAPGPFDLLLGGGMATAGRAVGEATGVPYRYVLFCPQMLHSASHPSTLLPSQHLPRWLNRLSWWMFDAVWNAAARKPINEARRSLGLPESRVGWGYATGDAPWLAADPWLAPAPPDAPEGLVPMGAWLMPPGALSPDVDAFLEAGPAPLYLGFGSMPDAQPDRTLAIFLEVIRRLEMRALISSGWAGLARADLPPTVRLLGPVDHQRLFPRCAAVVHHGGAGTTTAAALAGVSQVVVPHLGDQSWWAHRVHHLGIGPAGLPRRRLNAGRLERALRIALQPGVVAAARRGGASVSVEGVARAVQRVEALAARPAPAAAHVG